LALNGIFFAGPVADAGSALLTGTWVLLELRKLDDRHRGTTQELKPAPIE